MNQMQIENIIWRKNIQNEIPFEKRTVKIMKGLIWITQYDRDNNQIGWIGKKLKGGNK